KCQPLPEVQGKGKEKVSDEQVALDILTLQIPKKKSHDDQFIFQRRTFTPIESSSHDESSSLYEELWLTDSEAGPNPGDAVASQPQSSHVVHAGPNLEHMDLEATDVSTQLHPEQMDKGFTETAYPNVQENLKLTVEDQVILEEPASSTGTLSSLQHLAKDLIFSDLFFNDKPFEANNEKTTAETKAELMVSITIQQDTSSIPPMRTPIIDLTLRPDSPNVHWPLQATKTETTTTTTTIVTHLPPFQPQQSTTDSMLIKRIGELEQIMANLIQDNKHMEERLDSHRARLYTLENLDIPQQVSKEVDEIVTDAVDWAIQAPLQNLFRDLPEADIKEILHQRMWETNSYKAHKDHMMLYKALEESMNRDYTDKLLKVLAEARKKKKKRRDSPKPPPGSPPHQPPPPPPPAGPSRTLESLRSSASSQVPPPPPSPPSTNQEGQSHGSTAPSSLKTAASAEYKAWTTTDTKLGSSVSSTPADLHMDDDMVPEAHVHLSDDEDIGNAHIPKVNLRQDWWKPLEEDRPATPEPAWFIPLFDLPVSKNNWASALVSTYSPPPEDSLLAHISEGYRRAVRTHMRILSVVRIKLFSMYGSVLIEPSRSPEPYTTQRQKDSHYCSQLMDRTLGYQTTRKRLPDKYRVQMIMQFNEIHKFSDDTLHQIDEALDYRVKEFKVNRMNLGLNTRFWTRIDVDRSKEFMFAIQKRLKTRRIFCNLESFVGGRVRDEDYKLLKCTE
nr:hypothetical protein [Tanacetum cinerariifolium]